MHVATPGATATVVGTVVGSVVTVLNVPDTAMPPKVNHSNLINVDPATGRILWQARHYGEFTGLNGAPGGLLVHRLDPTDSQLAWLNARTGKQRWALPARGRGGVEYAVSDGRLVAAGTANTVLGLSAATGKRLWVQALLNDQLTVGASRVFVTQSATPKNPPGGD